MQVRKSILALVFLLLGATVPGRAQDLAVGDFEDAGPAIDKWLKLVHGGAAQGARQTASLRFQYRVPENPWQSWVDKSGSTLRELRPRRAIETAMGRDEPPLEQVDWVRIVYASERPSGGKVYERVVAVREDDGVWRVADYAAWPDPEAIVNNAALETIPYRFYYFPGDFRYGWRGAFIDGHRPPEPPADRGSARANPRTFPRRPPQ
jgi:hypothetical protein